MRTGLKLKTLFWIHIITIVGGFLSYYVTRASLVGYLWLSETQLSSDQRYWIHDHGELVFLVGAILSLIGCLVTKKLG